MQGDPARQPRRPIIIIGIFMLLTWAAVGFDYFSRPEIPEAQFAGYGSVAPVQFRATVILAKWQELQGL